MISCAEAEVRSFGGHLLDDVRGLERGLHCVCGTCLQPILNGDQVAKVGKALLHVGTAVLNSGAGRVRPWLKSELGATNSSE